MQPPQIATQRLANLQLIESAFCEPEKIVGSLCGVQSQNYNWAKWSVGLRLRQATNESVERAIADRRIVRTWAMRGTLHFVAAADVYWLLGTLSHQIIAGNARRYKQLGLDDAVFARANQVIEGALLGGKQLIRSELVDDLKARGISADGQRAPYLLQRAALDGIICHGLNRDHEPTYALLREWVPAVTAFNPDRGELAARYFTSHGPATLQDFVWWSGLSSSIARATLDEARHRLVSMVFENREFWAAPPSKATVAPSSHFLPPFDEFLLGYKDRTASLKPEFAVRVNAGGGMPKPTVAINGEVVGVWAYSSNEKSVEITIDLFRELTHEEAEAMEAAAGHFGSFFGKPVHLKGQGNKRDGPI